MTSRVSRRIALRSIRATAQTRVIAPCSCRPQSKPLHSCSLSPERERAERLARSRFRGRPLARRAARTPLERTTAHGRWFSSCERGSLQLNRGLGSSFSPAFRTRMDLSACWMSQGLQLAPTPPVRANCRPDMHSSRPLPLPWSARPPQTRDLKASVAGKVRGPPCPVPRRETIAARSVSVRDDASMFPFCS
jgi:hypothetical protein